MNDGFRVPEGIYLCPEEFEYYSKYNCLSEILVKRVKQFAEKIEKRYFPFFSIRAESKNSRKKSEIPSTMVNVGIITFLRENGYAKIHEHVLEAAQESYFDRISLFNINPRKTFINIEDELLFHIILFYDKMKDSRHDYLKGVILQRMVFGNMDITSGTGICCNWPGEKTNFSCFKGVFLPQHQGCPLIKGSWGYYELDLSELKDLNIKAYNYIKYVYEHLKVNYFTDPYIEFTIERENVYILQVENRQRYVRSTMI